MRRASAAVLTPAARQRRSPAPRRPGAVDSGLKTIRATVTDEAGAAAEASVNAYVILSLGDSGDRLESGKTYRVMGKLLTVPEGIDMSIGGISEGDITTLGLGIVGGGWVELRYGDFSEVARSTQSASGAAAADRAARAKNAALDTLIDEALESVGRAPSVDAAAP